MLLKQIMDSQLAGKQKQAKERIERGKLAGDPNAILADTSDLDLTADELLQK
jgi:hypothetical protein